MKRCVRSCGRHNAGCRELFGGTQVISGFIWIFMIAIHICIIVLMNTEIRVKAAIGVAVSAAAAIIYFRYPENPAAMYILLALPVFYLGLDGQYDEEGKSCLDYMMELGEEHSVFHISAYFVAGGEKQECIGKRIRHIMRHREFSACVCRTGRRNSGIFSKPVKKTHDWRYGLTD